MFKSIEKYFARRTAGRKVVEAFLRYGLAVHSDGEVYCGPIQMAPAKIGRALGVDRRVVIDTARQVVSDEKLGKVSIVGTGMQSAPGYASRMFRTLSDEGINIEMISTSEIRITCIIDEARVKDAVKALHKAFALDVAE